MQTILFILLLVAAAVESQNGAVPPNVANRKGPARVITPLGEIEGYETATDEGTNYSTFIIDYGIAGRFQRSEFYKWDGIQDGTQLKPVCPTPNPSFPTSEDCLAMYIYTPNLNHSLTIELRPVLVYIPGGSFSSSNANYYFYGPDPHINKHLCVATLQYRVGAFGFATDNSSDAPPNNGMMDQQLGMKWVKENIESFGCDPNQITVFGESAGAASGSYHLVSPESQGLFQKLILSSGSLFCPWASISLDKLLQNSRKLASLVGCLGQNYMECMRTKPANDIVNLQPLLVPEDILQNQNFPFAPTIESIYSNWPTFLTINPRTEICRPTGKFHKDVVIMTGTNKDELRLFKALFPYGIIPSALGTWVPGLFAQDDLHLSLLDQDSFRKEINEYYGYNNSLLGINYLTDEDLYRFVSDIFFVLPENQFIKCLLKRGITIYQYEFAFCGEYNIGTDQYKVGCTEGRAGHTDDLGYSWTFSNLTDRYGHYPISDTVREIMVTDIYTFSSSTSDPWAPRTQDVQSYFRYEENSAIDECRSCCTANFWNGLYAHYAKVTPFSVQKSKLSTCPPPYEKYVQPIPSADSK